MEINYNVSVTVSDAIEQAVETYINENMGGTEYYDVHTEESRKEAVREYIEGNVWAFQAWFIADHTSEGVTTDVIEILQEKCEGANEAILQLIEGGTGLNEFVEKAVQLDGYGHFLSAYDGVEHEIEVEGELYFIYAN